LTTGGAAALIIGAMAWLAGVSGPAPEAVHAAAPIRVAVEQGAGNGGTGADAVAQLNDDTYFDFTATLVTADQIDTPAELANYDVVVLGDSGNANGDLTLAVANALLDWAQNDGGGIVSLGWLDYATGQGGNDARDAVLDDLMPIDAFPDTSNYFCSGPPITIDITNSSHPVTAGLSDFVLTTSGDVEIAPIAPDTGQVLGTATSGSCSSLGQYNAIVVGSVGQANVVYLGLMYVANSGYSPTDVRTGAADQLFEQAVAWAAQGHVTPPTPEPSTTPRPRPTATRPPNIGAGLSGLFAAGATPVPTSQPAGNPGSQIAANSGNVRIAPPNTGDGGLADEHSPAAFGLMVVGAGMLLASLALRLRSSVRG
jgi:uncharacterized membrane protein